MTAQLWRTRCGNGNDMTECLTVDQRRRRPQRQKVVDKRRERPNKQLSVVLYVYVCVRSVQTINR